MTTICLTNDEVFKSHLTVREVARCYSEVRLIPAFRDVKKDALRADTVFWLNPLRLVYAVDDS